MMMHNKIHNRTLFVAALSVYFGLLIVGAPSQVFAQTSSQIKEIENLEYAQPFEQFIEDLKKLVSINEFETAYSSNFKVEKISAFYCRVDGDPVQRSNTKSENIEKWLTPVLSAFFEKSYSYFGLTDCLPSKQLDNEYGKEIKVSVSKKADDLTVEVVIKKKSLQQARGLADDINQTFSTKVFDDDENLAKQVYKNTIATFENNQVFIVTHLPRAAIDELIKADAKTGEK